MTNTADVRRLHKQGRAQLNRLQRFRKTKMLDELKKMDPILFEHLVGALFEQRGFRSTVTVAGGDEGVDVVVRKGLRKAVVQCKRYDGSVGQPTIRDLYGTMLHNRANEAYLVTTAMLTKQAEEWAKNKPIHLIDGYELVNWIAKGKVSLWQRRIITFLWAFVLMFGVLSFFIYGPNRFLPASLPSLTVAPTPMPTEPSATPTTAVIAPSEPAPSERHHLFLPLIFQQAELAKPQTE